MMNTLLSLKPYCSSAMLQVVHKFGLVTSGSAYTMAFAAVAVEPSKLQELCEAIFEGDFKDTNWEDDIPLNVVSEKVQDFLLFALVGSKRLAPPKTK